MSVQGLYLSPDVIKQLRNCESVTPRPASVKKRQHSGELADLSAKQRPISAMSEHFEASSTTNTGVTDHVPQSCTIKR
ncbi:hypothetical protein J6590_088976 [Homalodisca vitripennis]|nr:hypothetical protein J6590_088976 [Homalodisca vitripennis]